MSALESRGLLLFVPATQPQRYAKAAAAGVDAVIVDLEDAVAPIDKDAARHQLAAALPSMTLPSMPLFVRINAVGSRWHEADLAAVLGLPVAGVMLPKAERVDDLRRLSQVLGSRDRIIALVETATGVAAARELARAAGRLAFGSIDFASDLGAAHSRDALLCARAELVFASRLAALPAPIDGITVSVDAMQEIEDDAAYAASLGYSGKLLIHPRQAAPAARGFRPARQEIEWAQRVLASAATSVVLVDGCMIDRPVRLRAEQILQRAALAEG
jgi:citrate lyase subunit beta/citryl-CoA lyase